jgi:copper chaperone CopZ
MKKNKVLNLLLLFAAAVVLVIFAFSVRLEAAADAVAVLKTGGMTCGSCAGRIEKALREKPGVATVEVDVDGGQVVVAYDSKVAKPDALAGSVTGIGYGSSVLRTFSAEEYKTLTGVDIGGKKGNPAGCACCSNK